ncbi:hypothetical protein [Sporosarcina sp. UB5]|uniref:hypothetical protein n=1 Tax=Sporosarcina sp. UB5 TaxID=3047463 RepID=UPI003D79279F
MDPVREFTIDMITYSYAIATILIVWVILNGFLKYKKEVKEIVVKVTVLLLLIVSSYFNKRRSLFTEIKGWVCI